LERIPPGHTPKEKPSASAKYVKRNDKWQKGVVSELLWFLGAGGIGWLTGKIVGGRGYGDSFGSHINTGLDVILGIVGGYVGGFVYTWAIPRGRQRVEQIYHCDPHLGGVCGSYAGAYRKILTFRLAIAVRTLQGVRVNSKGSKASGAWKETK
jgi:hypothetical protein